MRETFAYDIYGRLTDATAWDGNSSEAVVDGDLDGDGQSDEAADGFFDKEYFALSTIDNEILFQGRRYDRESGLYYFRHRQYDPQHGSFLTRDPAGYADSHNRYQFVNNNPIVYTDPWGEAKQSLSLNVSQISELYNDRISSQVMDEAVRILREYGFDAHWWRRKDRENGEEQRSGNAPAKWDRYDFSVIDSLDEAIAINKMLKEPLSHDWSSYKFIFLTKSITFISCAATCLHLRDIIIVDNSEFQLGSPDEQAKVIVHEVLHFWINSGPDGGHSKDGVMNVTKPLPYGDTDGNGIDDMLQMDKTTAERLVAQTDITESDINPDYVIGCWP